MRLEDNLDTLANDHAYPATTCPRDGATHRMRAGVKGPGTAAPGKSVGMAVRVALGHFCPRIAPRPQKDAAPIDVYRLVAYAIRDLHNSRIAKHAIGDPGQRRLIDRHRRPCGASRDNKLPGQVPGIPQRFRIHARQEQ